MFCQATGYGGTVQQGSTVEEKLQKRLQENDTSLESAAAARNLTVSFNADVSDGMNWKFVPTQRSVKISPGQSTLAFYTAHNLSDKSVTGLHLRATMFKGQQDKRISHVLQIHTSELSLRDNVHCEVLKHKQRSDYLLKSCDTLCCEI